MAPLPKVLFVLTSQDKLPNGQPTGWWLSEFAHPYTVLSSSTSITIASPKGGLAPLDPKSVSVSADDVVATTFLEKSSSLWEKTVTLASVAGHADEYAAIFYVGGHGPMYDLAHNEDSQKLVLEFYDKGKIIAAVCHGPVALAHVTLPDGRFLLEGLKVTGLSDSEEKGTGVEVPFSLEQRLDQASGGGYVRTEDWGVKVEVGRHGKLITGQNPASAEAVGKAIHEAIFGEAAK